MTAIVVAYLPNEQDVILETIGHLLRLRHRRNAVQVILAYNSPISLPVEAELRALETRYERLKVLKVAGSRSKAENINAALEEVEGDITALFDADHHPDPWALRNALRWFPLGYDVVQGRSVIRNRQDNWITRLIRLEFETMYAVAHSARSLSVDTALFGGSNGYWRTEVLRSLRMDPKMMTEDIDVSVRALLAGYRILHDRSVISSELAPRTLTDWFHQRLRWAQGWFQVTLKYSGTLLRSPQLRSAQKLYWTYMLPWREAFTAISPQAVILLLAIALSQARLGGRWHWDWFLTTTTILTIVSGLIAAAVAYSHLAYPIAAMRSTGRVKDERSRFLREDRRALVLFSLGLPIFSQVRNVLTWVAWLREYRRERVWISTRRGARPG